MPVHSSRVTGPITLDVGDNELLELGDDQTARITSVRITNMSGTARTVKMSYTQSGPKFLEVSVAPHTTFESRADLVVQPFEHLWASVAGGANGDISVLCCGSILTGPHVIAG